MWANLVGYWVLGLPLGFFLCFGLKWGIYGLWIGLTLALVVIALVLIARWKRDAERQLVATGF
jgi:MATE family multidrug resistance protein